MNGLWGFASDWFLGFGHDWMVKSNPKWFVSLDCVGSYT